MSLTAATATIERGGQPIVRDASVDVDCGKMTALIGPNGAGKSTLLRALAGELFPSAGKVCLDGRPIASISPLELAQKRSVMAQATPVVFDFAVEEILHLGWVQSPTGTAEQYRVATGQVVDECRIERLLSRTFNSLSGGERQRVQFARCLLQIWQPPEGSEARYLLLDEPTSSLDLAHELMVLRLAKRHAQRGAGVLVVLHDLNLAARFCDEVVLMFDGRVVKSGEPENVFGDELLSDVYATTIQVERHDTLERIVVHT